MEESRESLIVNNNNIRQNKCSIRCCKLIFFLICNGLSFSGGFLLNKYLELKKDDGSL